MRRLVITGNDTQENFAMLFGQHNVHGLLLWLHQQVRREVLIKPPPNSPMNAKVVELNLDENCPEWTPREMNIEEREEIMNINMMILGIHRYVQVQGVGVATVDEAYGFIASWYEGDWPKSRHLFDYAVKAMKCGQLAE